MLSRIIQASTKDGAWVLDPFTGSSTTGVAANLLGRRFLGIDICEDFLQISRNRKEEICNITKREEYCYRLHKQTQLFSNTHRNNVVSDVEPLYTRELPF